ncbi:MAG: DeoR/GlpR family DNA-binding transcription regulator, partial [Candidatus Humimicrobiaceae bacterium]
VEDGDVILIEAGTTGYQTAINIKNKKHLTVITNSCDIAVLLGKTNPHYNIILSGGILNTLTHSLVGPIADWAFNNINVDKAFIGISGIDIKKGITSVDLAEAQTKKNIINCAKKIIALCDHSKIGHIAMNFVAPITAVDVFITDSEADEKFLEKIKTLEITAIVK